MQLNKIARCKVTNIQRVINNEKIQRSTKIKALKDYYAAHTKLFDEWEKNSYQYPPPANIPYPEICRGMKCEAKTRTGKPCKNDGTIFANGRCKYHGGASTGPITSEGKKRVSMNAKNKPLVHLLKPDIGINYSETKKSM
jgi:hypothetical protein